MSGVILVIDELIDQGIVMHTTPSIILSRIKTSKALSAGQQQVQAQEEATSSLFSSIFSSARSQLAKTMNLWLNQYWLFKTI